MTRPAISAAAYAILSTATVDDSFPTLGLIRDIGVSRELSSPIGDSTKPGKITEMYVLVQLSDREDVVFVQWSGALAAEIEHACAFGDPVASFIGRYVKIEMLDSQLVAAYTVNGTVDNALNDINA